ncbi:FHA domain-containing protein [Streptomyces sp. NPDC046860]|uniref:FHA domain-containing protein n=1 Tax=Streptomyces sp. NPDC046860 TaxID=3154495 RepID=UPI0033FD138B
MPTCPNGHQSGSDDWCEVCGHRMAGAVPPPPPPSGGGYGFPPPRAEGRPSSPGAEAELCPQCRTPREGGAPFCEECRWNFLTNTATSYTPAAPPRQQQPRYQPPSGPFGGGDDGFDYQGSRPSQVNRPAEPIPAFDNEPSGPTPFGAERGPASPPPTSGGASPFGERRPGPPPGFGGGPGQRPGGPGPGTGSGPGQQGGPGGPGAPGGPGYGGPGGQGGPGGPGGPGGFGGQRGPGGQGGQGAPDAFGGQRGPGGPGGQGAPDSFGGQRGPGGPGGQGAPDSFGGQRGPGGPGGQGGQGAPDAFGGQRGPGGPGGQGGQGSRDGFGGQGGFGGRRGPGEQGGPAGPGGPSGAPPFGREPSAFGDAPSRQASPASGPSAPAGFPQEGGRTPAGGPSFGDDDWVISPPPSNGPSANPGGGYGYPQSGAAQTSGFPQGRPPAQGPATWTATIGPDREYFMAMMQRSGPEAAGLNLPAYSPEQQRTLTGNQVTIGRRRHSTGDTPDVDLSVPPEDPGVSHQHAVLVQQPDGGWAVVDQNSTNGTTVNGSDEPIQPFVPVPLQDGDRVHVGAWTTITVHRG